MGLIRLGNKPPLTVAPEDTVVRAARDDRTPRRCRDRPRRGLGSSAW